MNEQVRLQVREDSTEHEWKDVGNKAGDQPVPVNVSSLPLPSGAATSVNQTTANTLLGGIAGFTPSVFDYIALSYTGDNLTGVVFKTGGAGGTTVSTLTLAYTGAVLDSVTKT